MAVGYMFDGSVAPLTDYGWEAPAGQMYSSLNDLNKVFSNDLHIERTSWRVLSYFLL